MQSGMNQEKVSIIVPVYNVERYLSECIESLINQTYQNLEIILIDDESPDSCGIICDSYAKQDARIKVIHKKNGGAASARNEGLKIATGDFLSFVDSDDYLELDAYENMMKVMKRTGADVVQCAFRDAYVNQRNDRLCLDVETCFDTQQYLRRFTTDWTCAIAWDKLFKREVLNGIYYETGHAIDDEFFTYQGIMNARKIVYSPVVVYNYRRRTSSVMNNPISGERMLLDRLDYSKKRRDKVVERFPELKQVFDLSYLDSLLVWSKDSEVTVSVVNEIKTLIKKYFRENKPCRMNVGFILQLFSVFIIKSDKLVQRKCKKDNEETVLIFFE